MNIDDHTPAAYDYPLLIKYLLNTTRVYAPTQEIIYRDEVRYTYTDFLQRLENLASSLVALDVQSGDVIAMMDYDSHRYLECFFAVPMMGCTLHTVNIRLSPEQILYTINHAEDDVIIVHQDFLPLLEQLQHKFIKPPKIIIIKDNAEVKSSAEFIADYESLTTQKANFCFADFDENTRATLFYTTGTTGDPKGVFYSHRQLVLHTLAGTAMLSGFHAQGRFQSQDVYMPITPMFHVHAWGIPYVATMLGTKQVYCGRYEPEMILKLLTEEKVTFSHCVPTILHMLLSSPSIDQFDLSGWKVVIGGAALPQALCEHALQKGIDLYSGYGMSESCPIISLALLRPQDLAEDPLGHAHLRCKSGLPIPLVDMKIVDENMQEQPADGKAEGEVVVRAPWLTQGYHKDEQQSAHLWRGGYLHTGDIGYIDPQGYLKITDRLKDVIKTGGEWISSLQLEDIIVKDSGVAEVAVIGQPDERWGERPCAIIVLREGAQMDTTQVQQLFQSYVAEGTLSKWAIPDRVVFVTQIEKTSVGKVDKKLLRKKYNQSPSDF